MLLETPIIPTNKIIIFLPGISGGASSERFRPLVQASHQVGFAIARLDLWNSAEEAKQESLEELHQELDGIIGEIKSQGYKTIAVVGKSFGGGLWMAHNNPAIDARVLWAPATGMTKVDFSDLDQIQTPVCVIHGTADDRVPFADSEKLVAALPNAKLVPIPGANHSFDDPRHEKQLINETVRFLTALD